MLSILIVEIILIRSVSIMKKSFTLFMRTLCCIVLLCGAFNSRASHIVGADLFYTHISGLTYKVTVILYGDCGPASSGAFSTLPTGTPRVCVYNGATPVATLILNIEAPAAGTEITPVCPAYTFSTQCTSPSFATPGIKKFVYSTNYTFPTTSAVWRMVFNGAHGSSSAGRAAAITNLAGGSTVQLIDTLDNRYFPNTSPLLTVVPTPFFCKDINTCYSPGAVDPNGDSLRFALIAATNGTTACTAVGAAVGYSAAFEAWPGQPNGPATPLRCVAGSFNFDPATGQVCFNANFLQRSVVVYNIQEYRNDTFKGTSQREMTFLVLTCPSTAPYSGTVGIIGGVIPDDSLSYHICGNAGSWALNFTPGEEDTTNTITCTATGYAGTGISFTVMGNGTNHPTCTISGAAGMAPGLYNVFVTLRDNNCPLNGITNRVYSIHIYPVAAVSYWVVTPATCLNRAVIAIQPGGTGKPWTIKISDPSIVPPLDTFQTWVDSLAFYDTLAPGDYMLTIFTAVSSECNDTEAVHIAPPTPITPRTTFSSPTYCGANDGFITIRGLVPGSVDTIKYNKNGVPQTPIVGVAAPDSTIVMSGLYAGVYSNYVVSWGFCVSNVLPPDTLVNPPFTWRALSSTNPTKCGFCEGKIVIYGLHPSQLDSIKYNYNSTPVATTYYIGLDSQVILSGLCQGSYTGFTAITGPGGVCQATGLGPVAITWPTITAGFRDSITYGCSGDPVFLTNLSSPDTELTYTWFFGDGVTDTITNPVHIYTNTPTDTSFTIKLYVTNTKCVDSFIVPINLVNHVRAEFTLTPDNYLCQGTPLQFDNTSIGRNPNPSTPITYTWLYGDGSTSTTATPTFTHTYANTGRYQVALIAGNTVPCYDTLYKTIEVDTISGINMLVTDTVICLGQGITFSGLYSPIGNGRNDSSVVWSFGDGKTHMNATSILHAYDQPGTYTVGVNALYRACPDVSFTRQIEVRPYPSLYLGPDQAICPGGNPIPLKDERNIANPAAKWIWNTDEYTPGIMVTKPGTYAATVTVDGCSSSDTVWVANDCYMSIPNVFTPNGDGVNDYFFPRQLLTRGVTSFTMNIYNRWGQLLYETNAIDGKGWDGTLNNVPQPAGVYVYVIDGKFKDGQVEHHQGNVTIMR